MSTSPCTYIILSEIVLQKANLVVHISRRFQEILRNQYVQHPAGIWIITYWGNRKRSLRSLANRKHLSLKMRTVCQSFPCHFLLCYIQICIYLTGITIYKHVWPTYIYRTIVTHTKCFAACTFAFTYPALPLVCYMYYVPTANCCYHIKCVVCYLPRIWVILR